MRVDYNVPMKDGSVKDPTRLKASVDSINLVMNENPKRLVLLSHMGRPNGNINKKFSLEQILPDLNRTIN